MPWCPKCRTEYREGFAACADCGTPLVEVLEPEQQPAEEPQALPEPVYLTTITDEHELELFTQLLHSQRIPFFTQDLESGEYMRVYMGFSVFGQAIYVPKGHYALCQQLLAQTGGEYGDAEMEAAYDAYMDEEPEPEEEPEEGNGNYRILLVFLGLFGALVLFNILRSLLI